MISIATLTLGIVKMVDDDIVVQKSYAVSSGTTLYDAVENEISSGNVSTYTGDHADKPDGTSGGKNVYYYKYYSSSSNYKNYVVLADMCWRIIRTTDTGGVKLIWQGPKNSSSVCESFLSTSYKISIGDSLGKGTFGYKFKTNSINDTDSTAKKKLDEFYEEKLYGYEEILEDTTFCNDRRNSSGVWKESWNSMENGYYYTAVSGNPNYGPTNYSLLCPTSYDRFAVGNDLAKLDHPIGLITSSEMKLFSNSTSNSNPLGDYVSDSWTLTPRTLGPSDSYPEVWKLSAWNEGFFSSENTLQKRSIRPVISISNGAEVSSGTGSRQSPFILKWEVDSKNSYAAQCASFGDWVHYSSSGSTYTATFYYQSNANNGSTTVSTKNESCTTESSESACDVTIPSAVKSSVGTYNNSYNGLADSTGTASSYYGPGASTITLTGDKSYYAVYSSEVNNYYYE